MLVPIYFIMQAVQSPLSKIVLSVAAGAPVYFVVSVLLRSEEARFITDAVRRKLSRTSGGDAQ